MHACFKRYIGSVCGCMSEGRVSGGGGGGGGEGEGEAGAGERGENARVRQKNT